MEKFFETAMNLVKSDSGIIIIVVLFVLLVMVKVLSSKTKKLNQKQTFSFLNIVWIGSLLLLFALLFINLSSNKKNKFNDSIIDNRESNITIDTSEGSLNMDNSIKSNENSNIHISM